MKGNEKPVAVPNRLLADELAIGSAVDKQRAKDPTTQVERG